MEKSRSKYLIKNVLIFMLGGFGSKIITFFLIPLYTNILTTEQYGIVDLITTISIVAVPVLTANISESVMRFGLDKNSDKTQNTQIGTAILMSSLISGLLLFPICNSYGPVSEYSIYIYLYVFTSAACQIFLCDLRGKELLLQYSVGNILLTFFIAAFNIIFLLWLKLEIVGYLLAYILANAIVALYSIIVGKGYKAFRFQKLNFDLMKKMVKYSAVLIPNSFMWWIMNSSDRLMVTAMVGVAANGIYAVSYKLPTLVSTVTGIFNQAWSYSAIREEGVEDEGEYNNRIFKAMISVSMFIGIVLVTITKPFMSWYVGHDYYEAWKYTPFLVIGCVYLTLGTFMATSYTVHKDSFGFLFSGIFGAVFNVALNFLLIPVIGVYGAAVATCVSYIAVFLFRLVHTRKYIRYQIKNKEFICGSFLLFLSSTVIFWDSVWGFVLQIIICLAAMVMFFIDAYPLLKLAMSRNQ